MKKRWLIILLGLTLVFTSCQKQEESVYEETRFVLGTVVSIKLLSGGSDQLIDDAFQRLTDIEALMSVNLESSDIYKLNALAGKKSVTVSKETLQVIQAGIQYGDLSGGAFDISMGPIIDLWKIGTEEARVPTDKEIENALAYVDYQAIEVAGQSLFLPAGMRLDLGGIAKGYAADQVTAFLKAQGVRSGLVNLGGNIRTIGRKPSGEDYKIGIQDPVAIRNAYLGVVDISEKTVVTSGNYERYFEVDGQRYHHIFDDQTGYPTDNMLNAVTIVTDSSMDADALSTIVYSLGIEKGKQLIESLSGTEALFVKKDKTLEMTSGMGDIFSLTDSDYVIISDKE